SGPAHLNHQILSTRRGIAEAEQFGVDYVLKTRSDTRLHSPHIADFLTGMVRAFPFSKGCGQQERIAVLDYATRLYMPYHPSDILMFGRAADLKQYWSAPLCGPEVEMDLPNTIGRWINESIPEIILCRHYFEQLSIPLDGTLDQWWQLLADHFVVVDRASLGFFWPKYNYYDDHVSNDQEEFGNQAICSFRHWINLAVMKHQPEVAMEMLQEHRLGQPLPRTHAAQPVVPAPMSSSTEKVCPSTGEGPW
ncbi:MAG: WavE lipopolysaccharide synthesis family protein, partial [Pirellulales bacterium]|nr:WavE lipopolysaccharide synthesis family protein [Pirellulales bacterium]